MTAEQDPDYFYNMAEWDRTYHDIDTLIDSVEPRKYEIVMVGRLVEIKPVYVVRLPDPDDEDCETWQEFKTKGEAEAAAFGAKHKEGLAEHKRLAEEKAQKTT